MAKECKLIHINDGSAVTRENGNFHFVEQFCWTERYLKQYLDEGYELKHMVSEVTPAIQGEGRYCFYKSGFTFYLEREVPEGTCDPDEEAAEEDSDVFPFDEIDEECFGLPDGDGTDIMEVLDSLTQEEDGF